VVVLDVRRIEEHAAAAIDDAVNIPLHELWDRLDEVPAGEVWVHCAAGYRASIAASVLDAFGRKPVAVDDEFDNAEKVGLRLVSSEAA
jgi:rhodanese-related sulfurtransferase